VLKKVGGPLKIGTLKGAVAVAPPPVEEITEVEEDDEDTTYFGDLVP
jgi:hypothetical protein